MLDLNSDHMLKDNYRRFSIVTKVRNSPLQWNEVPEYNCKIGLTCHIAAQIGNHIYIHGGIKEKKSLKPTNDFYRINLSSYEVEYIISDNSPYLSQHACVVLINRYLVIIGGWNGHSRLNGVHVFDTNTMEWLKTPNVSGFPEKAGLSGHTANASIITKALFPEIIIIGREGSIKTQRRYGNAYKLCCNNDLSHFNYSEIHLNLDSRSSHCACILNHKLYIVGGRDDKIIDVHTLKNLKSDNSCNVVSNVIEKIHELNLQRCPIMGSRKAARKGHSLIVGENGFVILGGSSFINASHVADSAGFLFVESNKTEINYYSLGSMKNPRADGAYCITNNGDAYYHGGIGLDGHIKSELLMLKLIEE